MSRRTDARGWVRDYEYYGLGNSNLSLGQFQGNLKRIDYQGAAEQVTSDVSYTYHRSGKLKTVTDYSGVRVFDFHETWTGGAGEQLGRSGLPRAERLSSSWYGGHSVSYGYHYGAVSAPNGAPASLALGAGAGYEVGYGYDGLLRQSAGRRETRSPPRRRSSNPVPPARATASASGSSGQSPHRSETRSVRFRVTFPEYPRAARRSIALLVDLALGKNIRKSIIRK